MPAECGANMPSGLRLVQRRERCAEFGDQVRGGHGDRSVFFRRAITGYLRGMDPDVRPRLVLFGESLGALTMADMYAHRTVEAMDRDFVHSSLFLGTPSGTEFAKGWRLNPQKVDPDGKVVEVDNYGEYLGLPEERRGRVRHVLLSHYDDPIPKFGKAVYLREIVVLGVVLALWRMGLMRILGEDFFPNVDSGQMRLHARGPAGRVGAVGRQRRQLLAHRVGKAHVRHEPAAKERARPPAGHRGALSLVVRICPGL